MCEPSATSFLARARMSSYFCARTRLRKPSTRVVVFISSATTSGLGSRSSGTIEYRLDAADGGDDGLEMFRCGATASADDARAVLRHEALVELGEFGGRESVDGF